MRPGENRGEIVLEGVEDFRLAANLVRQNHPDAARDFEKCVKDRAVEGIVELPRSDYIIAALTAITMGNSVKGVDMRPAKAHAVLDSIMANH